MFTFIEDIQVPASAGRTRTKGALGKALDQLKVGEGFFFVDSRTLKAMYPVVAPKRFPTEGGNKKFKIWIQVENHEGTGHNQYGVRRMEDVAFKVVEG